MFSIFYITVDERHIGCLNVKRNAYVEEDLVQRANNPFAHPRVLVSDLDLAKQLVVSIIKRNTRLFLLRPFIIFHPLRKLEGKTTEFEKQLVSRLLEQVGSRKVIFYEGERLTQEEALMFARNSLD